MRAKFEELIESYIQNKVGISTGFITAILTGQLREQLKRLNSQGDMAGAGVGLGISKTYDQQIRTDKIHWIDNTSKNIHELELLDIIEEFIGYMNTTCYTGINAYEFHYALYETGSFYKRHLDQFRNNTGRKFSFITYLNEDWTEANGGQLVVYPGEEKGLILPIGGTSILFKSDELEHEVIPANRARMSITGWLKTV